MKVMKYEGDWRYLLVSISWHQACEVNPAATVLAFAHDEMMRRAKEVMACGLIDRATFMERVV